MSLRSRPQADPTQPTTALATLSRHGRSFRLAGNLLPRDLLNDAAELYSFCRYVDDLADEADDPDSARIALLSLRRSMLQGEATHPTVSRFLGLAARHCLDPMVAARLIDTMLGDLGPVRIPDVTALLRYAYGAAGTVGLLMCRLLGVQDPLAAPHALDLGVAMQLTNIARDVVEDARRDRVYLPTSWVPPSELCRPEPVFKAVIRVLDLAELYYASGHQGLAYLPWRSRLAVGSAASLYREIGQQIRALGPAYLSSSRQVVPRTRRLLVLGRSLPTSLGNRQPQPHDPGLHGALRGERGADGGAGTASVSSCQSPPRSLVAARVPISPATGHNEAAVP